MGRCTQKILKKESIKKLVFLFSYQPGQHVNHVNMSLSKVLTVSRISTVFTIKYEKKSIKNVKCQGVKVAKIVKSGKIVVKTTVKIVVTFVVNWHENCCQDGGT